jgi:NADH-quinone oxidoreductase subunit C
MKTEEAVQQLKSVMQGAVLAEKKFLGETSLEIRKENIKDVLGFFKNTPAGFDVLMDLTGVDYLKPSHRTKVVYWLHNSTNFERVRLVVFVEREEKIASCIDLWEGADWYERELYDLFGVIFTGRPAPERILMPDNWRGHPLRKDYPLTEEPVEFKHNVKPKVPSEIIPHVQKNKIP